ncbi:hypothetical protein BGZ72_005781 [Mortierella alpina]|nr:hypothetical protein BGZ72_005781 [Mortierella alpina]
MGVVCIVKYGPGDADYALHLPERDPGAMRYSPVLAALYCELHLLCKAVYAISVSEMAKNAPPPGIGVNPLPWLMTTRAGISRALAESGLAALISEKKAAIKELQLPDDSIFINRSLLNTAEIPFKSHNPVFNLIKSTGSIANGTLRTRGEAHITVITPPEYDKVLHPAGVTIEELNDLATMGPQRNRLQKARFGVECLGRVQVVSKPGNVFQQAVQIILKDYEDLVNYRWDVFHLFVEKGGNPALFDPESFSPHITLGYRHRDLFEADGVFKRKNACIRRIVIE